MKHFRQLFLRNPGNPILTADDWPYPVHTVFNPGATRLKDGRTLLLCRCEDRRGISHLTKATSVDGECDWNIDSQPTFAPDPVHFPEELWGVEDPRITYVPELERYVIAYTAFTKSGPGVALATTEDFCNFDRLGLAMQPEDKDAALFPRRFHGQFILIHRPVTHAGGDIWISSSPDLENWGSHRPLLQARRGAWWDAVKIGLNPPPIETKDGWLILYHGVRRHASGSIYRVGLALFDKDDPSTCLLRSTEWVFGPQESYELTGDVGSVVFPCGSTIGDDGDKLNLYYGAADTSICHATASIAELLDWIKLHGTALTGSEGQEAELTHFSG